MREMKDSGIAWIGAIPYEWSVCRLKNYAHIKNGSDYKNVQDENGEYPVMGSGGEFSRSREFLYDKESVLLGRKGTIDKPIYMNKPFWTVDTMYYTEIQEIGIPKYVYYLTTQIHFGFYQYGSAVPSMTQKDLNNVLFPLPPLTEQQQIITYLDDKCAKIDAIIEKHQAIIEKLNEYKVSFVTEAVTKGVNPDAELKNSGISVIGDIPSHWRIIKLKYLLSHIIDCPHETPVYSSSGNHLVIRTADQDYGVLRPTSKMYRLDNDEYQNRIRRLPLNKDDIVYGREGERWGLACLVPESNKYCLGQRMMQFRCLEEMISPAFAMWALNSRFVYLQGSFDTFGSTTPHVNISTMRNYFIPVPPAAEQKQIARHIHINIEKINATITKKEQLIDKLTAYKKSLIYEVVTGKKVV